MSISATTAPAAELSPREQRGNIARLTIAQALAGANAVVVYATGSIVGNMLAPDKALATLPLSIFVVGMAACILPAGAIARRHGRRAAFLAGTGCGVLVGLLAALAVVLGSFWLFCLGTFFGGAYAAVVLSFRFAAADGVSPERRARALSFVMGGGVLPAWSGRSWSRTPCTCGPPICSPPPSSCRRRGGVGARAAGRAAAHARPGRGGRPLALIARQPRFVTAVVCGAVSYLLMNFLMTAARWRCIFAATPRKTRTWACNGT